MRKVLNLGCGSNLIKSERLDVINLDANKEFKPDIVCNIIHEDIPLEDDSIDTIWMFHIIEHIVKVNRTTVLLECNRVLKEGGNIIITYPEFEICAKNFIENKNGKRDLWEATLFGRQSDIYDFHVTAMVSKLFKHELIDHGFTNIVVKAEHAPEDFNTIINAVKEKRIETREQVIAREVCGVS